MKETKITDPNLFMKLILVALLTEANASTAQALTVMMDYKWEVFETESPNDYHIIGCHPVAKRLDFYLTKTVIH